MRWIWLCVLAVLFLPACHVAPTVDPVYSVTVEVLASPTDVSLRGIHAAGGDVVWASGQNGTCLRSTDGGATWTPRPITGAPEIDFRDVHGFDGTSAVVLAAGAAQCVFRTEDAGATWTLAYANDAEGVFFDAMAFWDDDRGVAFGDPLDGQLLVIVTADGGRSWTRVPETETLATFVGEAGFAASGTCLAVAGTDRAWIGLGGDTGAPARIAQTSDGARSWAMRSSPLATAAGAGIFSLAMTPYGTGVAVGGDYTNPEHAEGHLARTEDFGRTWIAVTTSATRGYRSAVAWVPGTRVWLAAGPGGIDISNDDGRTWRGVSDTGFHAIAVAPDGAGIWLSGAEGRLARLHLTETTP